VLSGVSVGEGQRWWDECSGSSGQVDQDFALTRLRRINHLDFGRDLARLVEDDSLVLLWNSYGGHGVGLSLGG